MKIAFFGTPEFAAIILEELIKWVNGSINQWVISMVVTQPDRPVGRRQMLTPTPVKVVAQEHKIPVLAPQHLISNLLSPQANFQLPTSDLAILAAYGKIIPSWLLKKPKYGFLNIHPSLLPKYRGASPVQFALLNGEKKTGVTIIQMDEEVDHGPVIARESLPISNDDNSESLTEKLARLGAKLLHKILVLNKSHGRPSIKYVQNHAQATFTKLLKNEDGFIPFKTLKKTLEGGEVVFEEYPPLIQKEIKKNNLTIKQWSHKTLHNFIRAFCPWPSVWTVLPNKKRLKLLKSRLQEGKIYLDEIQLEGRKRSTDTKFVLK